MPIGGIWRSSCRRLLYQFLPLRRCNSCATIEIYLTCDSKCGKDLSFCCHRFFHSPPVLNVFRSPQRRRQNEAQEVMPPRNKLAKISTGCFSALYRFSTVRKLTEGTVGLMMTPVTDFQIYDVKLLTMGYGANFKSTVS